MTDDIRFSEAELELMAILWSRAPLAASEIIEAAPPQRDWSATTVKTMLARLVEKGALQTKAQGRRFLYTPTVERESVAAGQAGRLVDRLFGGRLSPLVAHLAANRDLTEDDLAELEALVKGLRK
jgi:BlaI family transcriptional regulator, penicillinase repressor